MLQRLTISLLLSSVFWLLPARGHQGGIAQAAPQAVQQAPASGQTTPPPEQVRAIASPRNPLPLEAASADVVRFSFIVYGDTRGRRDGSLKSSTSIH
jgi:hypothetical protein